MGTENEKTAEELREEKRAAEEKTRQDLETRRKEHAKRHYRGAPPIPSSDGEPDGAA